MSAFDNTLRRIGRDLDRLKVPWALVGGVAVSTRGAPRFTNDIDAAVLVATDADREQLVAGLLEVGYHVETLLEDKETGELVTVRLLCPAVSGTQFILDLLFATSGLEAEVVQSAARIDVTPRINLPVAGIAHLIAMKVLSAGSDGRARDADSSRTLRTPKSRRRATPSTSSPRAAGTAGKTSRPISTVTWLDSGQRGRRRSVRHLPRSASPLVGGRERRDRPLRRIRIRRDAALFKEPAGLFDLHVANK